MIVTALTISLIILAIYVVFQPGMLLGWVSGYISYQLDYGFIWLSRKMKVKDPSLTGKRWSMYLQKPLWECLPCMASVWTIIIMQRVDLLTILIVCGLNVIAEKILYEKPM